MAALAGRTRQEWYDALIAAGVPCAPINSVAEGVQFATDLGLEPVVVVGSGEAAVPTVRNPVRLSRSPVRYRLPPPGLDEHGSELRAWLSVPIDEPADPMEESP